MQCIATAIRISFHGKHGMFTSLRGRATAAIDDKHVTTLSTGRLTCTPAGVSVSQIIA